MIAIDAKDVQDYLQECKSDHENSMQKVDRANAQTATSIKEQ